MSIPNIVELTNQGWGWTGRTTITYTILAQGQLPSYYPTPAPNDTYDNVAELSLAQQDVILDFFRYIETIIPIKFDAATSGQLGDMTFGIADPGTEFGGAQAYIPVQGTNSDLWGDVWYFRGRGYDQTSTGDFVWATLHEILHALGLEHPFDDKDANNNSQQGEFFLSSDIQESLQFSVLTYDAQHPNGTGRPHSLALYDIAALQSIYGRNTLPDPTFGLVGARARWRSCRASRTGGSRCNSGRASRRRRRRCSCALGGCARQRPRIGYNSDFEVLFHTT